MSFRKQLLVGHVMSSLLVAGIACIAIVALHVTSASEGRLARELADKLTRAQRLRVQAEQVVAISRGYLLTGDSRYRSKFESVSADFESGLEALRAGSLDLEGERHATSVANAARAYVDAATVAAQARSHGDADTIVPFFEETLRPRREDLETSVAAFADHERAVFDTSLRDAQTGARDAAIVVVFAASLAVVLGLVLAWLAVRKLASQFERMRAARSAAKAAADAREEVLAIVSHDLRNPLSSVMAGAALLEETTTDTRSRRHDQIVRRAADRMTRMIDELLAAAKLETGALALRCEVCDATRMIEETIDLFEASAVERSIHLHADCAAALVVGDRERIGEVLSNLVGNALKFTPAGGEILLKVEPCDHAVRFEVLDTGPGVEPDEIPHLFDRYWQGGGTAHARGSLGLGLYICRKLVEAHHGSIGVGPRGGGGSAFWFTVPSVPP